MVQNRIPSGQLSGHLLCGTQYAHDPNDINPVLPFPELLINAMITIYLVVIRIQWI